MLLTRAEMLYYSHPVPTVLKQRTGAIRLFVTDTVYERNAAIVGTIVDVKDGIHVVAGRPWRVSTDGTYVTGHPLNAVGFNQSVIGLIPGQPGVFHYGTISDVHANRGAATLTSAISSDRRYPGSTRDRSQQITVTEWFAAAPWAVELMPLPEDSASTVGRKIAIAKERWQLNRAVVELTNEGYRRNWTQHLKELQANPDLTFLPSVRVGLVIAGDVMMPTATTTARLADLDERTRQAIRDVQAVSSDVGYEPIGPTSIPVKVNLPLDVSLDPDELATTSSQTYIQRNVRTVLNNAEVRLGQHTAEPFANGMLSYI